MRIVTNTAALMTPAEGKKLGIGILPVSVTVGSRSLRDYIDIDSDSFVRLLKGDEKATSSQPAAGEVMEQMEALEGTDEELLMLTVADGLSGEYMTAMGLRGTMEAKDRIHVINSGSLGGPLRQMARKAAAMRDEGKTTKEILAQLNEMVRTSVSFVIPADFDYLRKSGRIHQLTSKIGGALNLLPVLTQTEDRKRISLMRVRRTWKAAVGTIISRLQEKGLDENFLITVAYADKRDLAEQVCLQIAEAFPGLEKEVCQLSPSLITHGGPGCIVVQAVKK